MKILLGVLMFMQAHLAFAYSGEEVKAYRITGEITPTTMVSVKDLMLELNKEDSKVKILVVDITSPGGEAISGFTIARMFRNLSNKGKVIVEIHAIGLCASACTWILASGTPGHRYIDKNTFVLVHPLQRYKNGEQECADRRVEKDVEDKVVNNYIRIARELYHEFTGVDWKTVDAWLTCGKELVGMGQLAIELKMADFLE